MFLQQSTPGLNFGSVQLTSGNPSNIQQITPINMQGQVVQANQIQGGMNTGHIGTQHMIQQQPLQSTTAQVGKALQGKVLCAHLALFHRWSHCVSSVAGNASSTEANHS